MASDQKVIHCSILAGAQRFNLDLGRFWASEPVEEPVEDAKTQSVEEPVEDAKGATNKSDSVPNSQEEPAESQAC